MSSQQTSFRLQQDFRIISTGLAVPSLITNQNVTDMLPDLGITQKWLEQSVGIKQRHIAIDGMQPSTEEQEYLEKWTENIGGVIRVKDNAPAAPPTPPNRPEFKNRTNLKAAPGNANSDLCARAIRDAAKHAVALSRVRNNIIVKCSADGQEEEEENQDNENNNDEVFSLEDIDMIIVTTVTPDMPCPGTSTFVMEKLGLNNIQVMDIRSACCGFTTGLQNAIAYIKSAPGPSRKQVVERIKNKPELLAALLGGENGGVDEAPQLDVDDNEETSSSSWCSGTLDIKTVAVVGCEVGSIFGNLDSKHPAYNRGDAANASMIGDAASCVIVRRFDTLVPCQASSPSNKNKQSSSSSTKSTTDKFFTNPFGPELLHVEVRCIGRGKEPGMHIPCGGCVHPFSETVFQQGGHFFHHDFKKVLEYGAELYYKAIQNGLQALGKNRRYQELTQKQQQKQQQNKQIQEKDFVEPSIVDIDLFIPHQANGRITSYAVKMGVEEDKCHEHFSCFGNTANASLALGLYLEARRDPSNPRHQIPFDSKKDADGKIGIGINKKVPNPPLQEDQVVMCLAAESTKWLHGTICLIWHSMIVAGGDASGVKTTNATPSSSSSSSLSTNKNDKNSLSHKWKRIKSSVWFFILGLLLNWMKYISVVLAFVGVGGGDKNKKKKH